MNYTPSKSFLDMATKIVAAIPRGEKGKIDTIDPARARFHLFLCNEEMPPAMAIPIMAIHSRNNNRTTNHPTPGNVLGRATKKLAANRAKKPSSLKPPETISRIPAIVGIAVCFFSINSAMQILSGSGWIRTADQGLMSPLLYH